MPSRSVAIITTRIVPRRLMRMLSSASMMLGLLTLVIVTWTVGFFTYTCNSSINVSVNEVRQAAMGMTVRHERGGGSIATDKSKGDRKASCHPIRTTLNSSDTVNKYFFRANYPQEDSPLISNSIYFKPRGEVVTPLVDSYLLEPEGLCQRRYGDPFLLISIPSLAQHASLRDTIRNTWGSVVRASWPGVDRLPIVKIVFVFGRSGLKEEEAVLGRESRLHGDVLWADFVDSYRNLTYKSLTSLHWAATRCSEVSFFMKVDEDTFINIPYLLDFLRYHHTELRRTIVGYSINKPVSVRTGKWAVDFSAYPLPIFPRYVFGHSYVISADIVRDVVNASKYMPFIPVEDAMVTGVLAVMVNATRLHNSMFAIAKRPFTCAVVKNIKIAVTMVTEESHRTIWSAVKANECSYSLLKGRKQPGKT